MTIKAKSTDQVCIEQIGGYKTMAGWMWVSQAEECERLQQRLAAAEADEATCHCGQRLSQHYAATEHAAVEMERPCPYAERLAGPTKGIAELIADKENMYQRIKQLQQRLAAAETECKRWRLDYLSCETERSFLANSTMPELEAKLAAAEAARDHAGDLLHECTRDLAESEEENAKKEQEIGSLVRKLEAIREKGAGAK